MRAARWPDPGAVKRLTDLARSPEGRTVEECFPAIKPGTPTYEFAGKLLREQPHSLQSLSIVMRESLRRQAPRSLLVPPRRDGHDPEQLARVFDLNSRKAPVPLSLSQRERQVAKRTQLVFEGLHRIEKMWSEDALWFLFSRLTGEDAFLFQHLDQRAQVEGALFDALEDAIRIAPFMKVLHRAIGVAPYMDDYQRQIILHALEHVKEGEYALAVSPLLTGLEGAIKQAAVELSVIDEDRWLVGETKKDKHNRRHSADALIRELKLDQEFERFLHRALFGKRGNPIRHGGKPASTRRSALLAVVGVVGWMDVCLQISASSALANVMSLFLPDAVSRYRQLAGKRRELGSGDDAPLTSWAVSTGTLTSSRALAARLPRDTRAKRPRNY